MTPVLSTRALNRALLARQLLLQHSDLDVVAAVEHLVGIQAQSPTAPYFALWARLSGFRTDDLAQALVDREVVRIVVMRGTIHLLSGRDALGLRPVVQPVMDRDLRTNTAWGPGIKDMDLDALAAEGRRIVEQRPATMKALGAALADQWPDRDPASMAYAIRNLLPLVQVPPRGVWGRSGQPTLTTADHWLGRPVSAYAITDVVLRYLAAFGPASVRDVQSWCGLTGLAEAVERLRPQLVTFADDNGRELFDLPDAPRPDPDTPVGPLFVAPYDNLLLSHADRTRVMTDEHRKRLITINGIVNGGVLLDGFLVGTWSLAQRKDTATLTVASFTALTGEEQEMLAEAAGALLTFAAPEATTTDVAFASP